MKKASNVIMGVVLSVMCLLSCDNCSAQNVKGNGTVVTKDYQVSDFNELELCLPATLNFKIGEAYSCRVMVDENLVEYLGIRVEGKELKLKNARKNTSLCPTNFVVEITAPSLKGISLAGSGVVNVLTPLQAHEMEAEVTGSGDIVFKEKVEVKKLDAEIVGSGGIVFDDLSTLKLDVEVAGSGDVTVSGMVKDAEVDIAGSGEIDLSKATVENVRYSIAGSGIVYYCNVGHITGNRRGSGAAVQRK